MIEQDKKGKLRDQCQQYRSLFRSGTFEKFSSPSIGWDLDAGKPIQEGPVWRVVGTIMIAAGMIVDGKFDRDVIVRSDQLGSFVSLCDKNRFLLEEKFGKPLRKDLEKKPITALNDFLSKVGIKLIPIGRKVRSGSSGNEYKVDRDQLSLVEDIAFSNREIFQQNAI